MRKRIQLLPMLLFVFYSCKKSGGPNSTPGGGNPAITITSFSPLNPYPGDVITITGSGFDPDKTKDTVLLGELYKNIFVTQDVFFGVIKPMGTIISATSTEIKFMTDSNITIVNNLPGTASPKLRIQVKAPSKQIYSDSLLGLKDNLSFIFYSVDPFGKPCTSSTYAGDSIYVSGKGFYQPCSVSVDGKLMNMTFSPNNGGYGAGFLPITYFGNSAIDFDCSKASQFQVKVTNGDGKSLTKSYLYFPGPNSQLQSTSLDNTAYSVQAGKNPRLTFTGYALPGDFELQISGIDNFSGKTFTEQLSVPITGFPNSFVQTIDLGALPVPDGSDGTAFTIQLKSMYSSYGLPIAYFTLFK